ncbi:MAG TPA: hypothetical protein VE913_00895 [Longimicrobium sp.]|nr:hypothetical protein [Longimicrobium sp.]
MTGTYLRDILVVLFKPGTPQRERQAAIDLVRGQVIGGARWSNGDGLYYIRVPTDGKPGSLRPALDALDRLPQVQNARPEFVDMGIGPM